VRLAFAELRRALLLSAPASHFRPAPGAGLLADLAWRALALAGWRIVPAQPVPMRCVVVFHPHTSNRDFPVGLLAKWALQIRFRRIGKDSLFKWTVAEFAAGGRTADNGRRRPPPEFLDDAAAPRCPVDRRSSTR
jgi:hypothetical protein